MVRSPLSLAFGLILAACASGKADGATCTDEPECVGRVCALLEESSHAECTSACTSAADCPAGWVCGSRSTGSSGDPPVGTGTEHLCAPPCTGNTSALAGSCVDGVPRSCEEAGTAGHCLYCGCAASPAGPACDLAAGTCGPAHAIGEPCAFPVDCASGNCGTVGSTRVCLDAAGAACTTATCPSCVPPPGGGPAECSLSCEGGPCPAGERCTEQRSHPYLYYCRPNCAYAGSSECGSGWQCVDYTDASGTPIASVCVPTSW